MNYKHNPKLTPVAKTLRKNMTKEERHLWYDFLRTYPVRFLRQKVVDGYILDFYCRAANLAVEVDGSQHYEPAGARSDQIRTDALNGRGIAVIRVPNNEVNGHFEGVCALIDARVRQRIDQGSLLPKEESAEAMPPLSKGGGAEGDGGIPDPQPPAPAEAAEGEGETPQ